MPSHPTYDVVAAVVIHDGEVLCVQKPQTKYAYTSFHWEYPGGKVEPGETEPEALVRELQEEMDYPVVVDSLLCETSYHYPDFSVNLRFWRCHPADAVHPRRFTLREHVDSCWMLPAQLHTLRWCAADCILPCLFLNQDQAYRSFMMPLIPTVDAERIIGLRTPYLRSLAKHLLKNRPDVVDVFLADLPHHWFEENQLHSFLLSEMRDFDRCLAEVDRFLPFVHNWATCDQLSPRSFKGRDLTEQAYRWMHSDAAYEVRFGILTLMRMLPQSSLTGSSFAASSKRSLSLVCQLRADFVLPSDVYYVRMMQAWYVATAMAYDFDPAYAALQDPSLLEPATRRMAIRKGLDSFRLSPEQKALLRSL